MQGQSLHCDDNQSSVGGFMADSRVKDFCINTLGFIAFLAFVFALGYGWLS